MLGRVLLHSLDCSTIPLILTLECWVLSKLLSSTIFLSLSYDSTWDWTPVSQPIGIHSTQKLLKVYNNNRWLLAYWVECSPMVRETEVQSQVESHQRLKKWYLMPLCLALSIIRFGSKVKWSNPGKGVASSLTPRCSSYVKGSLWFALN